MDDHIAARQQRLAQLEQQWTSADIEQLASATLRLGAQRRHRNIALSSAAVVVVVALGSIAALRGFDRSEDRADPDRADPDWVAHTSEPSLPPSPEPAPGPTTSPRAALEPSGSPEADGSIEELVPRTRVERVDSDSGPRLVLSSGAARFGADAPVVEAGGATIEGKYAIFVVRHEVGGVVVIAERGEVTVTHGGRVERVAPGDPLLVPTAERGEDEAPRAERRVNSSPKPSSAWRGLASEGRFQEAWSKLEGTPMPRTVADRMLAADTARRSGHPGQATRYLEAIITDHPRHAMAPVAAFTLGRLDLEVLRRPSAAAAAFAQARTLAPKGPLASDALAREVTAWRKAGRVARAREAARLYLHLYPEGRHRDAISAAL